MPAIPDRRILAGSLLCAALAGAPAVESAAGDWPWFRGPGRDGVGRGEELATSWPAGGPPPLWRHSLGEGFSSVAVVGDRLYTLLADRREEQAVCLDAGSGRQLWRVRLDSTFHNRFGNGPRSTPTVDGRLVFVLSGRGRLAALDRRDGRVVWSRDLRQDFGAQVPTWGVSTSPHVEGELLVLDAGGRPGASIVALDKHDGEVVWTSQSDRAGYSSPLSFTAAGRRHLLVFSGTRLSAVSPGDGELLWRVPWHTSYDVNAAMPVFIPPDRVFVSSGYDTGAALLRIRSQAGRVRVEEVWRSREMQNQYSSSVFRDGSLYGFDNAVLKCLTVEDGSVRWRARGYGHGSLVYADGHLIVLGDRGRLALVEATPEAFQERASAQVMEGKTWTAPALSEGILYIRDQREILALDLRPLRAGGSPGGPQR